MRDYAESVTFFPSKIKCFLCFRVPGAPLGKLRGRTTNKELIDYLIMQKVTELTQLGKMDYLK